MADYHSDTFLQKASVQMYLMLLTAWSAASQFYLQCLISVIRISVADQSCAPSCSRSSSGLGGPRYITYNFALVQNSIYLILDMQLLSSQKELPIFPIQSVKKNRQNRQLSRERSSYLKM